MTFRQRLAEFIGGKPAQVPAIQDATKLPNITRGSELWEAFVPGSSLMPMPTEYSALTVSAIYGCVALITGAIASLPAIVYRVDVRTGERDRLYEDPLWWTLNEEMTPRWSAAAGWEFLMRSKLLLGDAFAIIRRGPNGMPAGIEPVHPSRVTVGVWPDGSRLVYAVTPEFPGQGGSYIVYDQDDILHVPGFGFDGMRGLSPLRYALRMTGSVALATQDFSAAFFANSARPDYALTTAQNMGTEQIDSIRSQIDERHRGAANAHRPMLLHSGLDIKTITMPIEDMQLIEMRKFQIEEIARIYGVPPFMVGHNEKTTSWGTGIGEMGIGFVRYTLRQHLNQIQAEFNRKLFRTASRVMEFDTFDLERADMKSMFDAFRVAIGRAGEPGFMAVEEVRHAINMKRKSDYPLTTGLAPAPQPVQAPA